METHRLMAVRRARLCREEEGELRFGYPRMIWVNKVR